MKATQEILRDVKERLVSVYQSDEAESLSMWLIEEILELKRMDILLNLTYELNAAQQHKLEESIVRLLRQEPVQYVLGKAPFLSHEFNVRPGVLIPRPETEELVQWILKENAQADLRVLDIGTGSGCIPVSLSIAKPSATVYAVDISDEALMIAKENNDLLGATVVFSRLDILAEEIPFKNLDIVISNPPYVRHSEKQSMQVNVLDHEPELALFVSDEDPLLFYRLIASKSKAALKSGGKLYFEINEAFGKEMERLLLEEGFQEVRIEKDFRDKIRFATARLA